MRLTDFARGLGGDLGGARSPFLKRRANRVGDLLVAAVAGDDTGAGRIPNGPDACIRISPKFEE